MIEREFELIEDYNRCAGKEEFLGNPHSRPVVERQETRQLRFECVVTDLEFAIDARAPIIRQLFKFEAYCVGQFIVRCLTLRYAVYREKVL